MPDLAGRFGRYGPDRLVVFHKLVPGDGAFPFSGVLALEGVLAEHQDVFVHIPQGGVARRLPRTPGRGGTCAGGLVPDDLAAHQQAQAERLFNDQGMQGYVRFAPQVGNVDAHAPARHQAAQALPPDPLQKSQVVLQRQVLVVFLAHVVGWGSDHQVDGIIR